MSFLFFRSSLLYLKIGGSNDELPYSEFGHRPAYIKLWQFNSLRHNSIRLMVIMFCDWLNSLRLMVIMFCDWLNSIRLMVIMFCDWLNSLGLMVLMLCDSHELCSFFYISIYLHLLYILISIYIDQFYCWRKPEDPEKTHLPVASHWPPRYNWNIVDSGVKHHKTKLTIVLAM